MNQHVYQFVYRAQFFDTDAMGVVHHSNYIRIMEIARGAWLRELGAMQLHIPYGPMVLGVTNVNVDFRRSAKFDDELTVQLQGRLNGSLLEIRYAIWLDRIRDFACFGSTELALLRADTLVPTRFPMEWRTRLRELPWNEAWPKCLREIPKT
ncbi:MAG: acyl-CoA thioesterase [Deltaproteobacteria bacterium]|nr:acyl-CoA thioesterase [Deltaproteobacteria bacterium]